MKRSNSRTSFLGFEFAPLMLPLERRMQTAASLTWICLFLFLPSISTVLLISCLYSECFKWITYLYVAWVIYDWNTPYVGGRKSDWLKNFVRNWKIWEYYRDFFPIKLVKTADFDPDKTYLVGSHPHGVLCSGAFASFATNAMDFHNKFPGITPHILTLQGQYGFPFYRELILGSGACSATKKSIDHLLKQKGHASILVVGGVLEAMNSSKSVIKLILRQRKGWIKLAITNGADLVPTFSFGEHYIYDQMSNPEGSLLRKIQKISERWLGFAPVIFQGRGVFQYRLECFGSFLKASTNQKSSKTATLCYCNLIGITESCFYGILCCCDPFIRSA